MGSTRGVGGWRKAGGIFFLLLEDEEEGRAGCEEHSTYYDSLFLMRIGASAITVHYLWALMVRFLQDLSLYLLLSSHSFWAAARPMRDG